MRPDIVVYAFNPSTFCGRRQADLCELKASVFHTVPEQPGLQRETDSLGGKEGEKIGCGRTCV